MKKYSNCFSTLTNSIKNTPLTFSMDTKKCSPSTIDKCWQNEKLIISEKSYPKGPSLASLPDIDKLEKQLSQKVAEKKILYK